MYPIQGRKNMKNMDDYKNTNCTVDYLSNLSPGEAESMIGKTVAKIEAHEYSIKIIFTDESEFFAAGATSGDCALRTDYD
jgi:hypothetical protein